MCSSIKLKPTVRLNGLGEATISDFWSWAYSDILSNRNRSIFAEFLIASALGCLDKTRMEWDACDLRYGGKKIEVKSAAYLQSWHQKAPSVIGFDIAKKRAWHADTNTLNSDPVRYSDVYVFCLYPETDPTKCNILDINAWEFYVVPTETIRVSSNMMKSLPLLTPSI